MPFRQKLKMTSVINHVHKLELLHTISGNVKLCIHYGKHYRVSPQKINIELPYNPAIPLLGINPKELESES